MVASDARTAAQLVAPGEEPAFFDDLGCLASYLSAQKSLRAGSTAYVADHRTKDWVRADAALYTRVPGLETPMGSHLLAHADAASREADPAAHGGTNVAIPEVFGPLGPPPRRPAAGGDGR
jgi:copper chaperone NosL